MALKPRMSCTKIAPNTVMPTRANCTRKSTVLLPAKLRPRKRRSSTIGSLTRGSTIRKVISSTAAATRSPMITGSLHPQSLPCWSASTRATRPGTRVSVPAQSKRPPAARASGLATTVSRMVAMATGTLTQKTSRQSISVSSPPIRGPRERKTIDTPA